MMGARQRSFLFWLGMAVVVVGLDRYTKILASQFLLLNEPVPVMASLNLTLLHNAGAAFSLLSDAGGWQRWLFSGLAVIVSIVLVFWIRSVAGRLLLPCALALIMGGALGNLWDRLELGYVVDFIQVYYGQWYWPAFNLADSAISIGAVLLIIDAFRSKDESSIENSA